MFVACDESGKGSSNQYLVIGSVWMDKENVPEFEKRVTEFRIINKFWGEIEWLKLSKSTSEKYIDIYKDFIELAFKDLKIYFRFIVVKKDLLDKKTYHQGSEELVQLKFMQLSISRYANRFLEQEKKKRLHIIFDQFQESKKSKEEKWRSTTRQFIEKNVGYKIEHFQPCTSHISSLIQLCDITTGAVSKVWNEPPSKISSTHREMIDHIEKLAHTDLSGRTLPTEMDFNIWAWSPSIR